MRAPAAVSRRTSRAAPVPGARRGPLPAFIEPSLALLSEKAPTGPQWLHEFKYDGFRIQARIDARDVHLLTRKGLDWTSRFSLVANALQALGLVSALLDGELVSEDERASLILPIFRLI
jgi:bifunctional non-homologous end joining protein LigD